MPQEQPLILDNLEYRIGGLEINPEHLKRESYRPAHLFVVNHEENAVAIYVAEAGRHYQVCPKFEVSLDGIVGGGFFYLDDKSQLVLGDYSGDYYGIPKHAAERFAELLVPEMQKQGIDVDGYQESPNPRVINRFWRDFEDESVGEVG